MKKTLIAAALAALGCSAVQAQSQVNLRGLYDVYFGQVKTAGNTANVVNSGGMSTSYWGIGGSEDLGNGLKINMALDGFFRGDNGQGGRFNGDAFFARDAYVGASGAFGDARIGRNTSPYFLSTIIFNPFGDSFTFSPMVVHTFLSGFQVRGDTGLKNSLRYTTPSFSGLTGDFAWSAGEENALAPKGLNRAYDLSARYFGGPLAATIVYRDINLDSATTSSSQKSLQLGGSYDLKVAKLFVQWQNSKLQTSGAADIKADTYQLGASVPLGKGSFLVSYAHTKVDHFTASTGEKRDSWAIGYDYPMSKRTDVYAAYLDDKVKNPESKNGALGVGIRHRF